MGQGQGQPELTPGLPLPITKHSNDFLGDHVCVVMTKMGTQRWNGGMRGCEGHVGEIVVDIGSVLASSAQFKGPEVGAFRVSGYSLINTGGFRVFV